MAIYIKNAIYLTRTTLNCDIFVISKIHDFSIKMSFKRAIFSMWYKLVWLSDTKMQYNSHEINGNRRCSLICHVLLTKILIKHRLCAPPGSEHSSTNTQNWHVLKNTWLYMNNSRKNIRREKTIFSYGKQFFEKLQSCHGIERFWKIDKRGVDFNKKNVPRGTKIAKNRRRTETWREKWKIIKNFTKPMWKSYPKFAPILL